MPVSKQQQRNHKHIIKHQEQPLTLRALFKSSLLQVMGAHGLSSMMHHDANIDLGPQTNIDPLATKLNCRIVKSPAPGNLFQSFHKATWPNHFRHAFPMIKALTIGVYHGATNLPTRCSHCR